MRAARRFAGGVELNESLRERLSRKLDALSDERGYQVLDYVEFLESKFAERAAGNAFTRFSEAVEDHLRAGRVSAGVIAETMGLLNKAADVLSGAVAAGKSVASDLVSSTQAGTKPATPPGSQAPSQTPPSPGARPEPGTT